MQNRQVISNYVRSAGIIIFLTISSYSYLLAQHTFNFDTYNSNDAAVVPSYDNFPLITGKNYCIEVVGTYSIWPAFDWTFPCGTVESSPMFPSTAGLRTGFVGFDMEHYFSGPDIPRCSLTFPASSNRIQISLDNGVTWFFPVTSTAFNTNHAYDYQVTGMGFPIGVRQNDNLNADDYGILHFNILQQPNVDFGPDTTLCNNGNLLLNLTTTNATYLWQDNSTGPTFNVNQTGIYWAEVTVNSCSSSDTIVVSLSNLSVDLGNDTSLCIAGANLILDATAPNANYIWQNNSNASVFFVTQPGKYWVEVSDNNCTVSDTIFVSYPNLSVDLGQDTSLCAGENLFLNVTTPSASYKWQDNSTGPTLNTNQAGKYWVEITVNNCSASDTIIVTLNNSLVDLGKDTILCSGANLFIDVATPNASYLWQDNSVSSSFNITQAGIYWVKVEVNNCIVSDTIVVDYINLPVNLGNDTSLCSGANLMLDVTWQNATYLWQDNSADPTFNVTEPGKYWVELTFNNCTASDTILVNLAELNVTLGNDTSICFDDLFILNAAAPNATYLWLNDTTKPIINVDKPGIYSVVVTNQCETKTYSITISSNFCGECYLYFPNAFTPNNDNVNDTFFPKSICTFVDYELTIYNRWGETIYKTNDFEKGWNGEAFNSEVNTGVYVYNISYKFQGEKKSSVHGRITLIR
jgi:gliding motility-associated-like protein